MKGVVGQLLNVGPLCLAPLAYQVGGGEEKRPKSVAGEGGLGPTLEPSRT